MGGIYNRTTRETPVSNLYTRDDIVRYQTELSNFVAQFQQERMEAEAMFGDVRSQQVAYETRILGQDAKIDALTTLVVSLVNKVEVLSGLRKA